MSVSNRFIKYEVSELTNNNAKKWENDNMYRTSYFTQSEKNVK